MDLLKLHDKHPPRCTNAAQYSLWRNSFSFTTVAGFCTDCLPWYQKEMCQQCRCDHPEILFYVDDDGMVFGSETPRADQAAV